MNEYAHTFEVKLIMFLKLNVKVYEIGYIPYKIYRWKMDTIVTIKN
jgi:hypothetical protein